MVDRPIQDILRFKLFDCEFKRDLSSKNLLTARGHLTCNDVSELCRWVYTPEPKQYYEIICLIKDRKHYFVATTPETRSRPLNTIDSAKQWLRARLK